MLRPCTFPAAANAGAVDVESILEAAFVQHADRIRGVVIQAGQVREANIGLANVFVLGKFQHFALSHVGFRTPEYVIARRQCASEAFERRRNGGSA